MANISDQMDEIFDDGLDFDVIFDQEDKLIDTVAGVDENGVPVLGDEYADFFDENGNFIGEAEDVSIPGEPDTDDGKNEEPAGEKDLVDRTTTPGCAGEENKLERDAESDGTPAAPNSAEAQVDDMETPDEAKKDLGYENEATEEESIDNGKADDVSAPGEPDTDDGKNDEPAGEKAAETTMANGQNEQKPDDNTEVKAEATSLDEQLFDESVIAPTLDEQLFDESVIATEEAVEEKSGLDAELLDESFLEELDFVAEEADVVEDDAEEDLIDAVEDNTTDTNANLDYEVGDDDLLLDDLLN